MVWGGFALVLIVAPLVFPSGLGISMLSQIGIAIVACLSYNMLLGQGGMLSFGHAVYTGLGTFVAVHAMTRIGNGSLPIPVSLIPLVGGRRRHVLRGRCSATSRPRRRGRRSR